MKIAINGVGIAGPTFAYWIRRYGHEPVLFEKAPELRTGGYMIDFWGIGYEIAERMGLMTELTRQAYRMRELRLVGEDGRRVAHLNVEMLRARVNDRFVSLARGDLAAALHRACPDVVTRFGVSIAHLRPHSNGIIVELSDGGTEEFDLVIGADGLHSHVRELSFGPEARFERRLGCSVAAFRLAGYPRRDELTYVSHTVPGRQVARISLRGDLTLVLLTWRDELLASAPSGVIEQKAALESVFGGMKWEVREILERMQAADEIYFDRVSQIHIEHWSRGRVALLGDAAACASLLAGEGTGLAMTKAYVLAGELHRAAGDHAQAFARYETRLRSFVSGKQKGALSFLNFFAPKSRAVLALRDWAVRAASIRPLAKAMIDRSLRDDFVLPDYSC
jgi:2-polyprenyl-6-methoxyphenol hydroxylase-like FAD-dependent oxidoreductase